MYTNYTQVLFKALFIINEIVGQHIQDMSSKSKKQLHVCSVRSVYSHLCLSIDGSN